MIVCVYGCDCVCVCVCVYGYMIVRVCVYVCMGMIVCVCVCGYDCACVCCPLCWLSVSTDGMLEMCVFWIFLGSHSFFSFGHHATVTSLRFEAAFVGIHGEITKYNLPLAALLVGLNTMASQVSQLIGG